MLRTNLGVWMATAWLVGCVGGSDEPADLGTDGQRSEPDIGVGDWCGATFEDVAFDDAVDGFDATPREALEAITGPFVGIAEGASLELTVILDELVQVARVQRYDPDATVPADVVPVSICSDHYAMTGTMDLEAMPMLGLSADVDVAYFDGEDAGDGFGWDTASFGLRTEAWEGYAAPSWDPAEMEVVELAMYARWNGGVREGATARDPGSDVDASIWSVDLSFWGESLPTGTGDDAAVWAGEEALMQVDLVPDNAE